MKHLYCKHHQQELPWSTGGAYVYSILPDYSQTIGSWFLNQLMVKGSEVVRSQ